MIVKLSRKGESLYRLVIMRGLVEPRTLAAVISRRSGPSCSRSYSGGIGRGRGGGFADAEDSLLGESYGHGVPLNSPSAGRGGPLNAGRGGHGHSPGADNRPLLPNTSLDRGSGLPRPTDFDIKPPPSLNLGKAGFGRGKPVEKVQPQEELFSTESKDILSSWSKWDEKAKKFGPKDRASPAELRLLGEDGPTYVLPSQGAPQQQQQLGQTQGWQAPPPGVWGAAPDQQPSSASPRAGTEWHSSPSPLGVPPPRPSPIQQPASQSPGVGVPFQRPGPQYSVGFQGSPGGGPPGWQSQGGGLPIQTPPPHQQYSGGFRASPGGGPPRWQTPGGGLPTQAPPPQQVRAPIQEPGQRYSGGFRASPGAGPLGRQSPGGDLPTQAPPQQARPPPQQPGQQYSGGFWASPGEVPPLSWRSPGGGLPTQAPPPQQQTRAPPQQPDQQYSGGFQASRIGSPGWQSPWGGLPSQAPPQQERARGWQVPFDPNLQPQPFSSHVPPTTGWQQPVASMEDYSSSLFEGGEAYNTGAPPHISISENEWVQGGPESSYSEPYSVGQETHQPAWAPSTPQMSQQAYQMGDWRYGSTPDTMQGTMGQSQQDQGQYLFGSGGALASSAPSQPSSKPSSYDYDWGQPTQEELASVDVSVHADAGLDYDRRIEECHEQGKFEDMDAIFSEMKTANIRASPKTYDTLMQSYIQLQRMDKVSEVYMEMRREVVLPNDKGQSDKVKESPITASGMPHPELEDREEHGLDSPKPQAESEKPSFTSKKSFAASTSSSPSAKVGMGRGKKLGGFFDFDFSGSLGVGGESLEVDQEVKPEMPDDYSQTFKPVMQPGLLNFSSEGLFVGPGAGRGRPQSPQARDFGLGGGLSFQAKPYESGAGRGTTSSYFYGQDMQQEPPLYARDSYRQDMQQEPPLYARDSYRQDMRPPPLYSMDRHAREQPYDYPQEQGEPSLDEEEAAERAMKILNKPMSRRYQQWYMDPYDDDGEPVVRRSPVQLVQAKAPKEKKQRKKPAKLEEEEKKLTDEVSKEEVARLKAIEQNETIQELQGIMDSVMKCYGEMALEPEHELGDFTNPDIDEKPPMSLEEYLEKAKPNIMKTGLIAGEKQWQRMVKEALKSADHLEEFVERHSGPGRYTAKEENEDLEEIAGMLPLDVGRGAKNFVQRSLTTLKSNPGFNLDEKQWMLANMVDLFAQFPAKTRARAPSHES